MNILNVLLDNRIGGVQVRVLAVGKELKKYGIETIIVAPKGEGKFAERANNINIKTYQILLDRPRNLKSLISILANIKWLLTFIFSVFIIRRIIKKENIHIVHTNGLLNLQSAVAAVLMKKKIVWHLIGSVYPRIVVLLLMPFIRLVSEKIILVAKVMSKYYLFNERSKRNIPSLIYEPVDISKFNPDTMSEDIKYKLKEELNIEPQEKIIGTVSNLNPAKGIEYFIQSAKLVKKHFPKAKFIIVGSKLKTHKSYYNKLITLANSLGLQQDIIFTGKRNDIPNLLSIFDIFVMSSLMEGTPIAILEAMAMGVPVVSTNVGGISEQLVDRKTGILVKPRDSQSLANAMIMLLKDANKRIEIGKKARARVKKLFSLDICVKKHKKIYEEILSH